MLIGSRSHGLLILACIELGLSLPGQQFAQNQDPGPTQLTVPQIVDQLVKRNAERANALESYRGRRLYRLDYVGFPKHLHAEMLVDMKYTAPASKEFTVVSQSGEKWIIDHVLKRLIETEREAVEGGNWKRTALDNQNYNFTSWADAGTDKLCPLCSGGRTASDHQASLPRPGLGECERLCGLSNRRRARQEPIDLDQADRHSSCLSEGWRFLAAQGEYECFHYSAGWARHADHRVPELRNPDRASSRGNRCGGVPHLAVGGR